MSQKHATTLIKSLCARRASRHARAVFDGMPDRDVVAWTAMISGYASNGRYREALDVFRLMAAAGVAPNEFTLSSVLAACRGGGGAEAGLRCRRHSTPSRCGGAWTACRTSSTRSSTRTRHVRRASWMRGGFSMHWVEGKQQHRGPP
jgi:pentatricopeptide repeat protein